MINDNLITKLDTENSLAKRKHFFSINIICSFLIFYDVHISGPPATVRDAVQLQMSNVPESSYKKVDVNKNKKSSAAHDVSTSLKLKFKKRKGSNNYKLVKK